MISKIDKNLKISFQIKFSFTNTVILYYWFCCSWNFSSQSCWSWSSHYSSLKKFITNLRKGTIFRTYIPYMFFSSSQIDGKTLLEPGNAYYELSGLAGYQLPWWSCLVAGSWAGQTGPWCSRRGHSPSGSAAGSDQPATPPGDPTVP